MFFFYLFFFFVSAVSGFCCRTLQQHCTNNPAVLHLQLSFPGCNNILPQWGKGRFGGSFPLCRIISSTTSTQSQRPFLSHTANYFIFYIFIFIFFLSSFPCLANCFIDDTENRNRHERRHGIHALDNNQIQAGERASNKTNPKTKKL